MPQKTEIRIGLLWHAFGRPNLGVDALSRSNVALLRAACLRAGLTPRFVLLGKPGTDQPTDVDIEQGPYLRIRQLLTGSGGAYFDALRRCDLIVDICAGDGFTDIYGAFELMLHSMTKWAALNSKRPLILAPQTIGPFRYGWSRAIASSIINRCRMVFTRDSISTTALAELSPNVQSKEVIDVAFYLPFEKPQLDPTVLRVGVNVSGILHFHPERFQLTIDHKALLERFVERMLARPNTEVWLISHVVHDEDSTEYDDSAVAAFAERFPAAKTAPKFRNAVEAKSFIAGMDLFTGGRMHACIGAFSAGVPVVPIAYSRKFNGLFETLGYRRFIDGRVADTETALAQLMSAVDERAVMAQEIAEGLKVAKQRLGAYEDAMVATVTDIAKRPA